MHFEPFEKETIITFNEAEDFAVVYTRMRSIMSKMKDNGFDSVKEVRDDKNILISKEYNIPINCIKISKIRKNTKQRVARKD